MRTIGTEVNLVPDPTTGKLRAKDRNGDDIGLTTLSLDGIELSLSGYSVVGKRKGWDDVEVEDFDRGLVLRSPNGTRWRAQISNNGVLTWVNLG